MEKNKSFSWWNSNISFNSLTSVIIKSLLIDKKPTVHAPCMFDDERTGNTPLLYYPYPMIIAMYYIVLLWIITSL